MPHDSSPCTWICGRGVQGEHLSLAHLLYFPGQVAHDPQLSQVCVIGTDIPELSQPILDQALHLLDEYKVISQKHIIKLFMKYCLQSQLSHLCMLKAHVLLHP